MVPSMIQLPEQPGIEVTGFAVDQLDEVVRFNVEVRIQGRLWIVSHRYNEFDDLHAKLKKSVSSLSVKLPPKKFRPTGDYLEKRRVELGSYLNELIAFFELRIPLCLSQFLHFFKFQPNALLHQLHGFLEKNHQLKLTSLHLNALHETEKGETGDENINKVVAILRKLKTVNIYGTKLSYIETSNLSREHLVFDLRHFEQCEELTIKHCSAAQIRGLTSLKGTLKVLEINGVVAKMGALFNPLNLVIDQLPSWAALSRLNITNANLKKIDESILLLPNLENLNMHGNELTNDINLDRLLRLTILDLSANQITSIDSLFIGNISILNLSNNKVKHLAKLSRLLGLVSINLSDNEIDDIDEVCALNRLPMLQSVELANNPLTNEPDYRSQILGRIPSRINDLVVDCVIPNDNEIAMGRVIAALRNAKLTEKERLGGGAANGGGRNFNVQPPAQGPIL